MRTARKQHGERRKGFLRVWVREGIFAPAVIPAALALAALAPAICLLAGCVTPADLLHLDQSTPVLTPAPAGASPLARALHYLQTTQTTADEEARSGADWAGDWPQYVAPNDAPDVSIRDVSPFMVTFIHHALTRATDDFAQMTPGQRAALGVPPEASDDARAMRQAAVVFMRRFEVPAGDPAAGTYGFWPRDRLPATPPDWLLSGLAFSYFRGPVLVGTLGPATIGFYPPLLAIPPDADDTATIYAALLDDGVHDAGTAPEMTYAPDMGQVPADGTGDAVSPVLRRTRRSDATGARLARFFSDWRDLGQAPRRLNPPWLPAASGAFLTQLAYDDPPGVPTPNDVDLVVNANVLRALARYGRLDTPGAAEAVALINAAVAAGYQRTAPDEISIYYPDNFAFHYCVSRAYREGPVAGLAPAVAGLADELEATVLWRDDGTAYWDKGDPALNTALAALTLMNADRRGPTLDAAIAYLLSQQDAVYGGWPAGVFFVGRMTNGAVLGWRSAAMTTAMCLEALCEYEVGPDAAS